MERGFVAAEVSPWEGLVRAGGYAAAREEALPRVEGRDYVMRDGDVVTRHLPLHPVSAIAPGDQAHSPVSNRPRFGAWLAWLG